MFKRRDCLRGLSLLPLSLALPRFAGAAQLAGGLDVAALKAGFRQRLTRLLAQGQLPYIDIESSCNAGKVDVAAMAAALDELGIGLMALSSDLGEKRLDQGVRFDEFQAELSAAFPDRFIPVGNGGGGRSLEIGQEFIAAQGEAVRAGKLLLLGEYEFRHYPSPRQFKRGATDRDVNVPLDGPLGHHIFRLSEDTGLVFQLHYEIEDALLPVLESMLQAYPKARVVWCHVAQIRYLERASRYSAAYLDDLLRRFPGLHCDTAFGDAHSVYPPSHQAHARIWAGPQALQPQWLALIVAHPGRFLSALDMGQDRMDRLAEYDAKHRLFLSLLPASTRHEVAYRAAWRLLFGEEFA